MPVKLPFVPSLPNYRVGCTLGTTPYIFDVYWNPRDNAWRFDVLDADQNPLYTSVKVVIGTGLGRLCTNPAFPSGVLQAFDLSGKNIDAGFDDLGARVVVYYYTAAEFLAL